MKLYWQRETHDSHCDFEARKVQWDFDLKFSFCINVQAFPFAQQIMK